MNILKPLAIAALSLAMLVPANAGFTTDKTTKTMSADFAGEWCYGGGI
jgi:hypothetical protein